jgi:hypothetical protein
VAGTITGIIIVAFGLIVSGPAMCGLNQNAKVAVHVMVHDGARTCNQGMPEISGCADVVTTLDGCGDIDFFPVFLEVVEYQGVEYGITWPGSYSCAFTSCSDLKIGDIVWVGDGVSQAWLDCQPGPIAVPGWGWTTVIDSGHIRVIPYPRTGEITIGACSTELDDIEHVYCAGVCGAIGDDPSGWGYNPLNIDKSDGLGGECTAPGRDLTYTIRYHSPNFNQIHDVILVDYLPSEVDFVSTTGTASYDDGAHTVSWDLGTLGQEERDSAQVIAHIPAGTPYGTLLANRCRITGLETGPSEVEMLTTVCTGGFQPLSVAKSDGLGDGCTVPGAAVAYTITYGNHQNPGPVHDVTLVDFLSPETEFVTASDSGFYDSGEHSISWNIGTLGVEASGTVQAQVVISTATEPGAMPVNRCRIVCNEAPAAETAETTFVCPAVFEPLVIIMRARGSCFGPVFPGDDVTYNITYRNSTNPYAVHGVRLRDELPPEAVFISAGGGGTYDSGSHVVTWDIGTLAPDQSGSRQVVVNLPLATEPGTVIVNLCEILSDEAPRSSVTEQTYISSSGECLIAIHVRPHQPALTCAEVASDVRDCEDILTTAGECDVDVFPVFFEICECQGIEYALTWPSGWGDMVFTSCSDLTEGNIVSPGDGVVHRWSSCRSDYLIVPGYGRLVADGPGLVEMVYHPITGQIKMTTCRGFEYWLHPVGGMVFRAGACGAAGDRIDCGGPQRTMPTTWSGIKAMFK